MEDHSLLYKIRRKLMNSEFRENDTLFIAPDLPGKDHYYGNSYDTESGFM